MLYLCIYIGILYDFLLKLWLFVSDFFRAIIQNVSTKKAVSTTKKGFYFPLLHNVERGVLVAD
jgi:hypothetical protein